MDARTLSEAAATRALAASHITEEKLLVSRLRLEGIVQSAKDCIITVDGKRKIVLFSHAVKQIFCCKAEKAMSQPLVSSPGAFVRRTAGTLHNSPGPI